jgi:hypothetical protein
MVENSVGRGLAQDVLPLKPTVVTIKFGMNDHSYEVSRGYLRCVLRSQTQLAKVLKAEPGSPSTPQPIEDKRPDPDRCEEPICAGFRWQKSGRQNGATSSISSDPYMAIMMHERASNPSFDRGGDAVHPGPAGHTIMAWAVLKGLGASAGLAGGHWCGAKMAPPRVQPEQPEGHGWNDRFDRIDETLPIPVILKLVQR